MVDFCPSDCKLRKVWEGRIDPECLPPTSAINGLAVDPNDQYLFLASARTIYAWPLHPITGALVTDISDIGLNYPRPCATFSVQGDAPINHLKCEESDRCAVLMAATYSGAVYLFWLTAAATRTPGTLFNAHRRLLIQTGTSDPSAWSLSLHPNDPFTCAVGTNAHKILKISIFGLEEKETQATVDNSKRGLTEFTGHQHNIPALAFSPSGALIASTSIDATVRIWNAESGDCICTSAPGDTWGWGIGWMHRSAARALMPAAATPVRLPSGREVQSETMEELQVDEDILEPMASWDGEEGEGDEDIATSNQALWRQSRFLERQPGYLDQTTRRVWLRRLRRSLRPVEDSNDSLSLPTFASHSIGPTSEDEDMEFDRDITGEDAEEEQSLLEEPPSIDDTSPIIDIALPVPQAPLGRWPDERRWDCEQFQLRSSAHPQLTVVNDQWRISEAHTRAKAAKAATLRYPSHLNHELADTLIVQTGEFSLNLHVPALSEDGTWTLKNKSSLKMSAFERWGDPISRVSLLSVHAEAGLIFCALWEASTIGIAQLRRSPCTENYWLVPLLSIPTEVNLTALTMNNPTSSGIAAQDDVAVPFGGTPKSQSVQIPTPARPYSLPALCRELVGLSVRRVTDDWWRITTVGRDRALIRFELKLPLQDD